MHEQGFHGGIQKLIPGEMLNPVLEKIYDSAVELAKNDPTLQKIIDEVDAKYSDTGDKKYNKSKKGN